MDTERKQPIQMLVINNDTDLRRSLTLPLQTEGYQVVEATTTADGETALTQQEYDVVVTDLRPDDETGHNIVSIVKRHCPSAEVIVLTAADSTESADRAIKAGAVDTITGPFSDQQLLLKVRAAVERKQMRDELSTLRQHVAMSYGFDNIVGISKSMAQWKETARRIANTDITVLITGPSGSGKELFARAIHHHSDRRNQKFVTIDCSAIPEALLESELFGRVDESSASDRRHQIGLLEEADGGTVFLDEVSNMPTSVQVKLLRFLQDSELRSTGSSATKRVDVRVLAATNRELSELVTTGEFREDLYYRLNVIPLKVPSLIDRAEDTEMLTEYFIRKICREMGRETLSISREAVDRLISHSWPGNVRELENTLKRAIALCSEDQLSVGDISFVGGDHNQTSKATGEPRRTLRLRGNLMDSSQRSVIAKALIENDWNFTKTATDLGIGRTTLWRKVKKYRLSRESINESEIEESTTE
jgi:DNA-binding NtrC family response regulator